MLFGTFSFEEFPTLSDTGKLTNNANPWAKQLISDVHQLEVLDGGKDFLHEFQDRPLFLVNQSPVANWFCNFDPAELRVRWLRQENTDDELAVALEAMLRKVQNTISVLPWKCEHVVDGGDGSSRVCGALFIDKKSLANHLRKVHGIGSLARQATLANQCLFCKSTFADVATARNHVVNTFATGI